MIDPRTKLIISIIYAVSVFLASTLWQQAITLATLILLIALSKTPLKSLTKNIRPILTITVISALITIIFHPAETEKSIITTLRVLELLLVFNLLSLTTKPKDMAAAIETFIPSRDFAAMLSIAFRFLPLLADEAERIIQAQRSRGADFDGNLIRRAKQTAPILVPLFVSAFRKANNLSAAMDARLYGTAKPTRLHPLHFTRTDLLLTALSIIYLLAFLLLRASL